MSTKSITITEEAYERLRSRKGENQSFSEVILQNFPAKRKLSEILAEIGKDDDEGLTFVAAVAEWLRPSTPGKIAPVAVAKLRLRVTRAAPGPHAMACRRPRPRAAWGSA